MPNNSEADIHTYEGGRTRKKSSLKAPASVASLYFLEVSFSPDDCCTGSLATPADSLSPVSLLSLSIGAGSHHRQARGSRLVYLLDANESSQAGRKLTRRQRETATV
eukprot:80856-Rhodomonas_salina.2